MNRVASTYVEPVLGRFEPVIVAREAPAKKVAVETGRLIGSVIVRLGVLAVFLACTLAMGGLI